MWESLPPVVSSSATPAEELKGVSLATHSSGMISGSSDAATNIYGRSTSTSLSRNLCSNTVSSNGNSVSRLPGPTGAPAMSVVVAALSSSTAPPPTTVVKSNPFAVPHNMSFHSVTATGSRDVGATPNLSASQSAPYFSLPMTNMSLTAETTDSRQGVPTTAPVDAAGRPPPSLPVRESPASAYTPTSTLPDAVLSRGHSSSVSVLLQRPVPHPPSSQSPSTFPLSHSSSAGTGTGASRAQGPSSASAFPSRPAAPSTSSTVSTTPRSNPLNARTVSPRYPSSILGTVKQQQKPPQQLVSPTYVSSTSGRWWSPSSLHSSRVTNDSTALFFSPVQAKYTEKTPATIPSTSEGSTVLESKGPAYAAYTTSRSYTDSLRLSSNSTHTGVDNTTLTSAFDEVPAPNRLFLPIPHFTGGSPAEYKSGTSSAFTPQSLSTAGKTRKETSASSPTPDPLPMGFTTASLLPRNSSPLRLDSAASFVRTMQRRPQSPSSRSTTSTATSMKTSGDSNTDAHPPGSTPAGASRDFQNAVAHRPVERRLLGSVNVASPASTSVTSLPRAPLAPTTTATHDVGRRYAMPPGVNGQGEKMEGSANMDASDFVLPIYPSTLHAVHTRPQLPPQHAEIGAGAGDGRHVHNTASAAVTHRKASPSPTHAPFNQYHGLPPSIVQVNSSQNFYPHHQHSNNSNTVVSSTDDVGDALYVSGTPNTTMDHNQSFYLGTTGNINLRRSFFFPQSALLPISEREDTTAIAITESNTADEVTGQRFDLASSLRHAVVMDPLQLSTAECPNVSGASEAAAAPVRSTSAAPTETTDEEEHYCSPSVYQPQDFPSASPSEPATARLPQQATPTAMLSTLTADPALPSSIVREAPQPLARQQQVSSQQAPQSGTTPSLAAQAHLQPDHPEEPLRILPGRGSGGVSSGVRSYSGVPDTSLSAASPYVRASPLTIGAGSGTNNDTHANNPNHSGYTLVDSVTDSPFNMGTDASFISPTLVTLTLRHRFEDSVVNASETCFTPLEIANKNAPPHVSAAAAVLTRASLQLHGVPTPPYALEWERSLIAFQSRAESYYAFKNSCTETYLTLIEHDVDRFLVCYYSGGGLKPEEAVQEALASRAGTPAVTSSQVLSNATQGSGGRGGKGSSPSRGGGGLRRTIQTNKTLQKLSEAGSKWLTSLRKTALSPVPVRGETKAPSSSAGTLATAHSSWNEGSSPSSPSVHDLGYTPQPLPLSASHHVPKQSVNEGIEEWWIMPNIAATTTTSDQHHDSNSSEGVEPTYGVGAQSTSYRGPCGLYAVTGTETTSTDVAPLLMDGPRIHSGKSLPTSSTLPDTMLSTSTSVMRGGAGSAAGTFQKHPPLSRLSHSIAAEEELRCLRQLGSYTANVIPETYMDVRPSEQALQHVRRNYPIILNALQHVLLLSGVDAAPVVESVTPHTQHTGGPPGVTAASEGAKMLIASRLRQGLLMPSIQATWRDYLSPLEMKVKELVQIAATNIDPILEELQLVPSEDISTAEMSVSMLADLEARQRLHAMCEQPVRRLARLLRGDEEYLATIHTMDDEFMENGEAWQVRCTTMRHSGAALSDYVPVYGLVLSRLHRLEIEHRTVLELWCGGVQSVLA